LKIHFLGACRQVTGSRYCLETRQARVMIDCGMFQERQFQARNWHANSVPLDSIDALLLTHAHIDHCGLVPRIVKQGFGGSIYSTPPTTDLVEIMLRDAAHIQSEDLKYKLRRHQKEGRSSRHKPEALFDDRDVQSTVPLLCPVAYENRQQVADGVCVTFHEAGHILGSAMLELEIEEGGQRRRVIFSGDIGQWAKPLIQDPTVFEQADYVVMESTYGDRDHEKSEEDIEAQLETVINETAQIGGNVLVPTFAVERAQELMYHISRLAHNDRIPDVPVFLDSPMAIDVTQVFRDHRDRFDDDTWRRIEQGLPPLDFPGLVMSRTADQSRAINDVEGPCVIMSTSGMCTAGRIKHHLKRNLPRPESTVLFVGYQAHGTLGRQILEGKSNVRIHGKPVDVRANVRRIYGCSGHADRSGLLHWSGAFKQAPRRLFLTHGEEQGAMALAHTLRATRGWDVLVPDYQSVSDLR